MLSFVSVLLLGTAVLLYAWFLYKSANNISYLVYKSDFVSLKRALYFYICALSPNNKKFLSNDLKKELVDSFYVLIGVWDIKNRTYVDRLRKNLHQNNFEGKYDDELVVISCFIKLVDKMIRDSEEKNFLEKYSKGFNLMENRTAQLTQYIDFLTSSLEKKFKKAS